VKLLGRFCGSRARESGGCRSTPIIELSRVGSGQNSFIGKMIELTYLRC
jgi:hypothetical protein